MSFIDEIRCRDAHPVAIVYLAGMCLLIRVVETLLPVFGMTEASYALSVDQGPVTASVNPRT